LDFDGAVMAVDDAPADRQAESRALASHCWQPMQRVAS
jgi:hypothetical protein